MTMGLIRRTIQPAATFTTATYKRSDGKTFTDVKDGRGRVVASVPGSNKASALRAATDRT
ncbi:hypothetical protein [Streptomyces sp.]|uniref:hypothetical protein n=1 Tax=Streptomyces sp. TaxID=1931 RepID=UPI002F956D8B